MKITAIDTFTLRIPTQKPIALDLPEHRLVVTRIQTDADTDGLGYALVFGGAGSESVEAYARRLATLLIGEDPTQVGRLWDKMYRADREPQARRGREEGRRRRRPPHGRRQPEARRRRRHPSGARARGPRSGLVRRAHAGRRSSRLRRDRARDSHSSRHRREQLHAL